MEIDYLIVGSGLTGSVIARLLTQQGHTVQIVERRNHAGGNVHDFVHESGIRIHTYGPHYFRTSSRRIWDFVNTYSKFYKFEACVQTLINSDLEIWPMQKSYIESNYGKDWQPAFKGKPENFEQASLAMMPEGIYRQFVKGYTEKQWGVPADTLEPGLAKRFSVRDGDSRLLQSRYQGLPENGYVEFMQNMIKGIPLELNFDYLKNQQVFSPKKGTVFTGPIDEFFDFKHGKLKYRAQKREHEYLKDTKLFQPVSQVNNPSPAKGPHIRTIEWKHCMKLQKREKLSGTVLTREIPFTPTNPDQYEYPFPDTPNSELAKTYKNKANELKNVLICGRLGEYRYYDMDQAIARAMMLTKNHLQLW